MNLKEQRIAAGLSQAAVAKRLGCSRFTVIRYEAWKPGGHRLDHELVEKMKALYAGAAPQVVNADPAA